MPEQIKSANFLLIQFSARANSDPTQPKPASRFTMWTFAEKTDAGSAKNNKQLDTMTVKSVSAKEKW